MFLFVIKGRVDEKILEEDVCKTSESDNKETTNNALSMRNRAVYICVLVIMSAFSYCIFAPIEYYFSNKYELWYDLYNILPLTLITFLGATSVLGILGFVLVRRDRRLNVFGCIITALSLCLYIQGNFVIVPYDTMNGEAIGWSKYSGYNLSSVMVWLGIIVICAVIFAKYWETGKALKIASIVLICMVLNELFTLTVSGI